MPHRNAEWGLAAALCLLPVAPRLCHFTAPPVDGQSFRQGRTAAIAHGLGPFRRVGHYHYWQVYRRGLRE